MPPSKSARPIIAVITSADAKVLQSLDLLTPIVNGFRKISLSVVESKSIDHSKSVNDSVYKPNNEYYKFPAYLESEVTFRWLGLDKPNARELWNMWQNAPDGFLDTFLQVAENWIYYSHHDAKTEDDDWAECLDHLGVTEELQEIILGPEFAAFRKKKTAKQWVIDTFRIRYAGLESIHKASEVRTKARAERDDVEKKRFNRLLLGGYAAAFIRRKKTSVTTEDWAWGKWVMGQNMQNLFDPPSSPSSSTSTLVPRVPMLACKENQKPKAEKNGARYLALTCMSPGGGIERKCKASVAEIKETYVRRSV